MHSASAPLSGKQQHQALSLDLLGYCLAPGSVTWPGQLPTVGQLRQLAVEIAHALEVSGHSVMALEALQTAQQCCKRILNDVPAQNEPAPSSGSHEQQQQQQLLKLNNWQDRLVTASLMRCLIDATHPEPLPDPLLPLSTPLNPQDAQHLISQRWTLHRNKLLAVTPAPDPSQWRKLAQQQLKLLSDAGVQIDADKAISRLQAMYDSLLPVAHTGTEEEAGVEAGPTGLFRSISGISASSTPRRNSTFSRYTYQVTSVFHNPGLCLLQHDICTMSCSSS